MNKELTVMLWSVAQDGVLCEASIRNKFQPNFQYRFSSSRYPAGTEFPGAAVAGYRFILQGACRYRFDTGVVRLVAGQYAALPAGSYWFESLGDEIVHKVSCFELPPAFWKPTVWKKPDWE